jgi:iron uptake system EfeUOB component EfeO/EfeM
MNHSKKLYNGLEAVKTRRRAVIERLERQLAAGTKIVSKKASNGVVVSFEELTESDVKRIKKELSVLKERI